MDNAPNYLVGCVIQKRTKVLTYMIHWSSAKLGIKLLRTKHLEIFNDKRPQMEYIVTSKGTSFFQNCCTSSQKLRFNGISKATRSTANNSNLRKKITKSQTDWTFFLATKKRKKTLFCFFQTGHFFSNKNSSQTADIRTRFLTLIRFEFRFWTMNLFCEDEVKLNTSRLISEFR